MAGLGTDLGEAAISPNISPGVLLPLLPRPEGLAHWATGGPHGSTLSLLGLATKVPASSVGLGSGWIHGFFSHFLGEATELEGSEEVAQYGRVEMRAQPFQTQDKQEPWLSLH